MTVSCSQDYRYSFSVRADSVTCNISSRDIGKPYSWQKSQLTEMIQSEVTMSDREMEGDVIIIDGSALINYVPSKSEAKAKTFCQRRNHMA